MIEVAVGQIWKRVGNGWHNDEVGNIRITGNVKGIWKFEGSFGGYDPIRFEGTSEYHPELAGGAILQLDETEMINLILSRYD